MDTQREQILEYLKDRPGQSATVRELMSAFGVRKRGRRDFRRRLRELAKQGYLRRGPKGSYRAPLRKGPITGKLTRHPDGYGFVMPLDRSGTDIFIPPDAMGSAIHGDIVDAEVTYDEGGPNTRRSGRIIGVRERTKPGIPGRFETRGKAAFVVPDDSRITDEIYIPKHERSQARDGDLVVAHITHPAQADFYAKGKIVRVLGDREDPTNDSQMVLEEFGLSVPFEGDVLDEAGEVPRQIPDAEIQRRRDLRDVPFVTIDGKTARDFDDAVAVERKGRGWRLYVAIADVAHYVVEGSELDRAAFERGTSVYFPDLVVPMLPEKLSNDVCSLRPDEDRLALVCAMDIEPDGRVTEYGVDRAVIRSRNRMTYHDVHQILEEGDRDLREKYRDHLEDFEQMRELAGLLRRRRLAEGSIDFDLPESLIVIDLTGETTDIVRAPRWVSHRLIEEFMLVANVTVARHLTSFGVPTLYRIHEPPDPEKIETFSEILQAYGIGIPQAELSDPKAFAKVVEEFDGRPEERLINTLLLRSMQQARYSTENRGHFGLAFPLYTHFTSPIRRYPDLMVHRQLHVLLERGVRGMARWARDREEVFEAAAAQSSQRERLALDAERAIIALKKVRFMRDRVGEQFRARVSGVARFGLFVELDEYFVEGLIRIDQIGKDDWYEFDEGSHQIVAERSGHTFRLGDELEVELTAASLVRRTIDFALIRKL